MLRAAASLAETEGAQARAIEAGESLRSQLSFDAYLVAREQSPDLTFREHPLEVGGAIET